MHTHITDSEVFNTHLSYFVFGYVKGYNRLTCFYTVLKDRTGVKMEKAGVTLLFL